MGEKKRDLRKRTDVTDDPKRNPDPLTGEPGSHPVGTGVGAAGGGTLGAAVGGAIGGPIGGVVGAAVGGVAGGLAGKEVAEQINPTVEDAYWRDNYASSSYIPRDTSYDLYQPAYRFGWETRGRYPDRRFEEVELDLARDWESLPDSSNLDWNRARPAVRDAWDRIDNNRVRRATP